MARKRFTPAERSTLIPGTPVEWRNVSHWHPATITGPIEADEIGWQFVPLTNHGTTRTVHAGDFIRGYPGSIRLRADVAAPASR